MTPPSPSERVTSQEFESIALKIEAEYRRKLNMDPAEEKKPHKKKKRKAEGESDAGGAGDEGKMPKKKKIKKENKESNKENDKKDKEKKSSSATVDSVLDNTKELFKDIKDGRIKPGAIIKSKDIAKKEGMVKKETKSTTE